MGDVSDYADLHRKLTLELYNQKAIFDEMAPNVIDPDGSPEYWEAKKKFDAAGHRITEIEKALAEMELESEPDYLKFLKKFGKLFGGDEPDENSAPQGVRG